MSRWSGLSPWVALLPWRMAGAASRNQVRGGLCARPCAGQAPGIKSGAGSVMHRGTGPTPGRSRGEDLCDACGVGGRGMEARRGAGGGGSASPCGALPGGTERPFKQSQEGDDPGSKQGTEAPRLPHESSTVAWATPAQDHSPVRAEGKPSPRAADPAGCAPRRPCPARQHIPSTAATSSVPSFPAGNQGGGPSRALAVDQRVPVPEPPLRTRSVHSAKAHRA